MAEDVQERGTVCFSHGRDSGPWGSKIKAMARAASELGWEVESIDYRGMTDPAGRVSRLLTWMRDRPAPVLVGSSMGGYVAAAAACEQQALGLFLLAPAFHMKGFEAYTPGCPACPVSIWHGWHDDVVPCDNSIRYAREHDVTLTLLNDGHRLQDSIDPICTGFRNFLAGLA
jgi:alpha/beta superfamily hydrolase